MTAAVRLRAFRWRQARVFTGTVLAVAVTGLFVAWFPDRVAFQQMFQADAFPVPEVPQVEPRAGLDLGHARPDIPELVPAEEGRAGHARTAREHEVAARFQQAVGMLHTRQYEYALVALHRVLQLAPEMPEAHVNMGFTLLGLEQYKQAYDFFQGATALRPDQSNAYYGMAVALEALGDIEGAMGAMRTFVHLSPEGNPYVDKAHAALWEWEGKPRGSTPAETAFAQAAQDLDHKPPSSPGAAGDGSSQAPSEAQAQD